MLFMLAYNLCIYHLFNRVEKVKWMERKKRKRKGKRMEREEENIRLQLEIIDCN